MDAPAAFVPLEHRTLEKKNLAELLTECARDGHFQTVKGLIEEAKVDVDAYNSLGLTAFQLAHWNKHFHITELLIQKGAKNISTDFELNEHVIKAPSFKFDPILEQRRIQIEKSKYLDALIEYVRQGCLTIVTGLIEEVGVDINAANCFGLTPLKQAAINGKLEIVDLLIRKGANVNAESSFGETALMLVYFRPSLKEISYRLMNAMTKHEQFIFAGGSEGRANFVKEFEMANTFSMQAPLIFSPFGNQRNVDETLGNNPGIDAMQVEQPDSSSTTLRPKTFS